MNKDFDNIDKMAKDAFENFEMDFNPEDWKRMEAKLDKKEHLLPHIWLFKGIEAMVLLLILVTVFNFWQADHQMAMFETTNKDNKNTTASDATAGTSSNHTAIVASSQEETVAAEKAQGEKNTEGPIVFDHHAGVNEQPQLFKTTQPLGGNNTPKIGGKNEGPNAVNTLNAGKEGNKAPVATQHRESARQANETKNTTKSAQPTATEPFATTHPSLPSTQVNNGTAMPTDVSLSNSNSNNNNHLATDQVLSTISSNNSSLLVATPTQALSLTETGSKILSNHVEPIKVDEKTLGDGPGDGTVEEGKGFSIKNAFKLPKLYHRQLRCVVFAGADMNLRSSLGGSQLGMSVGLLLENEISDRFSFRTGLVTTRKHYEDEFIRVIDHSLTEGIIYQSKVFQKTSLSLISIPIYANAVFFRDAKWRMSATVGASAQFLTHRFVSGTQRTITAQASGSVTVTSEVNPNAQEKALFQGGKMGLNTFMTMGLGVDIERRLGNRVSLFMQPMYQHALTTVGTAKDHLHAFTLNVGIKTVIR